MKELKPMHMGDKQADRVSNLHEGLIVNLGFHRPEIAHNSGKSLHTMLLEAEGRAEDRTRMSTMELVGDIR